MAWLTLKRLSSRITMLSGQGYQECRCVWGSTYHAKIGLVVLCEKVIASAGIFKICERCRPVPRYLGCTSLYKRPYSTWVRADRHRPWTQLLNRWINKNLCGRDGRTICGPQCVPKSTSVTLAVDEKTLPMATITGRTDGRTDRVRRNMRPPPREEGRIKKNIRSRQWIKTIKSVQYALVQLTELG